MYIRFNNNNIWERVDEGNSVTFYHRILPPKVLHNTHIDKEINEEELSLKDNINYSYNDWKIFFGEQRLKDIAANVNEEQFALPLIYYCRYILGLKNMNRIRSTKYSFTI